MMAKTEKLIAVFTMYLSLMMLDFSEDKNEQLPKVCDKFSTTMRVCVCGVCVCV